MRFFLEKRTKNQGYYRNLEFFWIFLYEVHNLEKSHICQDFIPDTLFWKNHEKNAPFRKITLIFGAFFKSRKCDGCFLYIFCVNVPCSRTRHTIS